MSVRPSVRQSVCPISQTQQRRAVGLLLSAVRAEDIDRQRRAPGSSSAAARGRSTALSSKCGQGHVDSRINKAEHRLGLLSIFGSLNFSSVNCLCGICVRMATCTELYIDTLGGQWTGLGWIDGQKSPVFCRGKSGSPSCSIVAGAAAGAIHLLRSRSQSFRFSKSTSSRRPVVYFRSQSYSFM